MAHCSLTLLGSMQLTLDGNPLEGLESVKVRALMAYLAVEGAHAHTREHLASLLWPEASEAQARQRLSQALYNIRQVLGEAAKTAPLGSEPGTTSFLLITAHTVQCNPHSDHWLDVAEFDRCITEVRQHPHSRLETCEACARLLQKAVQLFQGEFLAGISIEGCQAFEEWALVWRERLHRQLCEALSDLTDFYERRNDLRLGLDAAERWVHLDSFSEIAVRKLMRLLALDGQRTHALARYAGFRRLLAAELDVEPGTETRLLYERILAEEAAQTSPPGVPGRLPVPLTPFIGRIEKLAELTAWLRDPHMRLITILGPGGSGKTRLALQAARSLRYDYPDGLFLVPLSGLSSGQAFLPTLARTLGVVFQANWGDPFEQLLGYLQRRHLLLILDSFEEVPSAAHWIPRLLETAAGIQILVTSRARLNVQSEQVFPLDGLSYPEPESLNGAPVDLADYSALKLFQSAARQVRPDFECTEENLPHLVRICQLVDGMPLGLVLAAGWLETCTPAEIAAEIEHSLDFLSSTWSDVPERQRSLRATLDYSWRLLDDDECLAFQKLSVFQRTFTRPAAEQVAQVSANGLRRLVDKSMLYTGQGLYRMHDMLHQYAAEKLSADGDNAKRTKDAHCTYFLERLAEREPRMKSALRSAILHEQDVEMNDVLVAWNWACSQGQINLLSRSLEGLCLYYEMRVRYREAEQACQAGLAIPLPSTDIPPEMSLLRLWLLLWRASFLRLLGERVTAHQLWQKAGELLDQLETQGVDVRRQRAMYWQIGGDAQADLRLQLEYYQRGIALYQELGDSWRQASMLRWAGELIQRLGDATLCLQYEQEALRLARQVGEPNQILHIMLETTYIYFILNQLEPAQQLMQEARVFRESIDDLPARANAQLHLGTQLGWGGHFPEAIRELEEVLPLLRRLGYRYGIVYGSIGLALSYLMIGDHAHGETIIETNLLEAEEVGLAREAASCLIVLGMAALALGHSAQSVAYFQDSVRRYREMKFVSELGMALGGLALALEAEGQPRAAVEALLEALHIAEKSRSMFTMFTCPAAMVCLLQHRGHLQAALLVHRVLLRQAFHRNSRWDADIIGNELPQVWESLPEQRRLQIEASASQHTPFSILPEVIRLLEG